MTAPRPLALTLAAILLSASALAHGDETQPAPSPGATDAKAPAPAAEVVWMGDFDKAVERAKFEKKDLLVDFTGSDWCTWCIRLHDEVFSQAAFRSVAKDYVLVSLDFPRDPALLAKVPNPPRNRELAAKYAVDSYPTVLLMTADGDVFASTGYQRGGAEPYVKMLADLRTAGRASLAEAVALAAEFDAAKDAARLAVAEKAIAKVAAAEPGSAWTSKLVPALQAARESDADGAKGVRIRAVSALFRTGASDESLIEDARKLDPKNAKGVLFDAAFAQLRSVRDDDTCRAFCKTARLLAEAGEWKDAAGAAHLFANAAFWSNGNLKDPEGAKFFATKLKAIADPANSRIQELIESILGPSETKDGSPAAGEDEIPGAGGK